jgi:hypothetical protein
LPALTLVWPSGWAWHAGGRSLYLEMIWAVYMTLGVFLIIAARNPAAHRTAGETHVPPPAWRSRAGATRR